MIKFKLAHNNIFEMNDVTLLERESEVLVQTMWFELVI